MFNGKIHYNWPFSIAMLNYQRVVGPKILPSWNTIRVNVLSFNFCWPPKKKELDQTKKNTKKKQETLETDTCRIQHWHLH